MTFPTDIKSIWKRVDEINPVEYSTTRNFKNGAISYLSPYISRGIITSKQIIEKLRERGFTNYECSKFEQELAWREFWQRVWQKKGNQIYFDIKQKQAPIQSEKTPNFLMDGSIGIEAIDSGIEQIKTTGYMHNHMRMYTASVVCNIGQFHWKNPADWMYYHLLDGDVASNYLSWQWVAGANSNKKYIANQENINHFFQSDQTNTFLDTSYEDLQSIVDGKGMSFEAISIDLKTNLPSSENFTVNNQPIRVYNYYNLDPQWRADSTTIPVLLLEPSVFKSHPISNKCLAFMMDFNKKNLKANLFVGEFKELQETHQPSHFYFKEHPLNHNYKGIQDDREWMFEDPEKYNAFFSFWKKVKKQKIEKKQTAKN